MSQESIIIKNLSQKEKAKSESTLSAEELKELIFDAPDINHVLVNKFKTAIKEGQFSPDSKKIAQKILSENED